MRKILQVAFAAVALSIATGASAQSSPLESSARPGEVPLSEVISSVAKRTGKRFIVDRRASVIFVPLVGQEPTKVSYDELLLILDVNGFAAVESGGYVNVVPDAWVRYQPMPLVSDKEKYPDGQYVTMLVRVHSISAAQLVPLLRPLIPPQGQLSAMPCANTLIIADRFANVRRIEAIVKALDVGEPMKLLSCSDRAPSD